MHIWRLARQPQFYKRFILNKHFLKIILFIIMLEIIIILCYIHNGLWLTLSPALNVYLGKANSLSFSWFCSPICFTVIIFPSRFLWYPGYHYSFMPLKMVKIFPLLQSFVFHYFSSHFQILWTPCAKFISVLKTIIYYYKYISDFKTLKTRNCMNFKIIIKKMVPISLAG